MKQAELNAGKFVLVDDEDWPLIEAHRWSAVFIRDRWYAMASIAEQTVYLHRLLTNAPRGVEVDHIDHDGLNCQKGNLRLATRSQNAQNQKGAHRDSRTGVRGVTFDKRCGRYKVTAVVNYRGISGGYFSDLKEAERAAVALRGRVMTHAPECAT